MPKEYNGFTDEEKQNLRDELIANINELNKGLGNGKKINLEVELAKLDKRINDPNEYKAYKLSQELNEKLEKMEKERDRLKETYGENKKPFLARTFVYLLKPGDSEEERTYNNNLYKEYLEHPYDVFQKALKDTMSFNPSKYFEAVQNDDVVGELEVLRDNIAVMKMGFALSADIGNNLDRISDGEHNYGIMLSDEFKRIYKTPFVSAHLLGGAAKKIDVAGTKEYFTIPPVEGFIDDLNSSNIDNNLTMKIIRMVGYGGDGKIIKALQNHPEVEVGENFFLNYKITKVVDGVEKELDIEKALEEDVNVTFTKRTPEEVKTLLNPIDKDYLKVVSGEITQEEYDNIELQKFLAEVEDFVRNPSKYHKEPEPDFTKPFTNQEKQDFINNYNEAVDAYNYALPEGNKITPDVEGLQEKLNDSKQVEIYRRSKFLKEKQDKQEALYRQYKAKMKIDDSKFPLARNMATMMRIDNSIEAQEFNQRFIKLYSKYPNEFTQAVLRGVYKTDSTIFNDILKDDYERCKSFYDNYEHVKIAFNSNNIQKELEAKDSKLVQEIKDSNLAKFMELQQDLGTSFDHPELIFEIPEMTKEQAITCYSKVDLNEGHDKDYLLFANAKLFDSETEKTKQIINSLKEKGILDDKEPMLSYKAIERKNGKEKEISVIEAITKNDPNIRIEKRSEAEKAGILQVTNSARRKEMLEKFNIREEIENYLKGLKDNPKYKDAVDALENKVKMINLNNLKEIYFKPDDDFNKNMVAINAEISDLNSKIAKRMLEVGGQKFIKDDEGQILAVALSEKKTELAQMVKEYIELLDGDLKAGRISEEFMKVRENQINDPKYKFDTLPDFPTNPDDLTKEQRSRIINNELKYNLSKETETLFASEPEKKEAEFTGFWFKPGQDVTNDDLLEKVTNAEKRFAIPIEGDNWLKNREEYEARIPEQKRLEVIFKQAIKVIPDGNKQRMFEMLDKDSQKEIIKNTNFAFRRLLNADGKSEESKALSNELLDKADTLTVEEARELASKYLSEEELSDPSLIPYNNLEFRFVSEKNPKAWEPLIKGIPEENLRDIAITADASKSAAEMTLEEARRPRYTNEIATLKNSVDQMSYFGGEELTSKRKAELKQMLDNVLSMTSELDNEFGEALADKRLKREEGVYGMNRTRSAIAHDLLYNDGYKTKIDGGSLILDGTYVNKMEYEKGLGKEQVKLLSPKAQKDFQELKKYTFAIRPETEATVKDIFAKFDKYGYDQADWVPEQGDKVYSLHKYGAALENFRTIIKSKDPSDRVKMIDAAGKLQVEYDRFKDLAKEAGDLFGVNEGGYYPGNLDCERNHAFPPEFRNDIGNVSALNGLYCMYRTFKERNLSIDDFFKAPKEYLVKLTEESINRQDINQSIKGKRGAEAMFEAVRSAVSIDPNSTYGINRTLETIVKMEKDPTLREQNIASEQAFNMSYGFAFNLTGQRDTTQTVAQRHLDRFLIVDKPCEDASLTGAPSADYNNIDLIPSQDFDEVEYLINNPEDPKTFADRVVKEGCKFIEMHANDSSKGGKTSSTEEIPIERGFFAMQRAAIKFLAVHSDISKKSEAYKTLSKIAENGSLFIKEKLTELQNKGEIHLSDAAVDLIKEAKIANIKTKTTLKDFRNSDAMMTFGDEVRNADMKANEELQGLQDDVNKYSIDEAKEKLNDAIDKRKDELLKAFHEGKITEEYLNRRYEQLDAGKFEAEPPKMFEADQLKSKNEFIRDYIERHNAPLLEEIEELDDGNPEKAIKEASLLDLDELSKAEQNELYQRYVDNAKRSKEQFIIKKYLESEGKLSKIEPKTMSERIFEENRRLAAMERAYGNNPKEEELEKEELEEEQVKEEVKTEVKEQVKVEPKKEEIKKDVKVNDQRDEFEKMLDDDDDLFAAKEEVKVEEKVEVKEVKKEEKVEAKQVKDEPKMEDDLPDFGQEPIETVSERESISSVKSVTEQISIDLDDDNVDFNLDSFEEDMSKEMKKDTLGK